MTSTAPVTPATVAFRVPLNDGGVNTPVPFAPETPTALDGSPSACRVRLTAGLASSLSRAAASCWAGGTSLAPEPEPPEQATRAITNTPATATPLTRMGPTVAGRGQHPALPHAGRAGLPHFRVRLSAS